MPSSEMQTNFPSSQDILSPIDVYTSYVESVLKDKKQLYVTGPINTGGARRMHSFENLSDIEIKKLLSKIAQDNVSFANALLRLLLNTKQIPVTVQVTTPYALGARKIRDSVDTEQTRPWQETEYLVFWSMVILGISSEHAHEYYHQVLDKVGENTSNMNRLQFSRAQRIENYQFLESTIKKIVTLLPQENYHPINNLLKFPDAEYSLGSTFEQRLAVSLGVPISEVIFNLDFPYWSSMGLSDDVVFNYLMNSDVGLLTKNTLTGILPVSLGISSAYPTYKA